MKLLNKYHIFLMVGVILSCNTYAQSSCSKKMLSDLQIASDACLSDKVATLNVQLKKKYQTIIDKLPVSAPAESEDEYTGLTKQRLADLNAARQRYSESFCSVQASSYGLTKRQENREYSLCWIRGVQEHLKFLKYF